MSTRLNGQVRRLGQAQATRESAAARTTAMFPTRGRKTSAKIARLISRFLEGRRKRT